MNIKNSINIEILDPKKQFDETRKFWCILSNRFDHPFFLSWGWIENLIKSLPDKDSFKLFLCSVDEAPVMAFFLGIKDGFCNKTFPRKALFLNSEGSNATDVISMDYNKFLSDRINQRSLKNVVELLPIEWDEITMRRLDCGFFPGIGQWENLDGYIYRSVEKYFCRYVDLQSVRSTHYDYLSLLSRKTRSQINKSYRLYRQRGPIVIKAAENLSEALEYFDALKVLSLCKWKEQIRQGAFESDFFVKFHKSLIISRFKYGNIQLIKVSAGKNVLGYLYNFIYRGKVYAYQTGFNYESDNRLKPGFIAHSESIKLNALMGLEVYDFLGGNERYKKSMSTGENELITIRIQKPMAKFQIENMGERLFKKALGNGRLKRIIASTRIYSSFRS